MFPYLNLHGERCKMQEVARKKEPTKSHPHPPREPRGKTQGKHGKGNPPTQREEAPGGKGEGKHGKGHPTNPERNRKTPLDAERKNQKHVKIAWGKHLDDRAERDEALAQHPAKGTSHLQEQKNNKNKTHKSCRRSVLLILVVLKQQSL